MTVPAVAPGSGALLWLVRVGLTALLLLQLAWHGWLPPPRSPLGWTALVAATVPLLLVLPGAWAGRPMPLFWANVLALLYFCHGVSEAWTTPEWRWLALLEVALATAVVCAYGAFGLRSRRAARAAVAVTGTDAVTRASASPSRGAGPAPAAAGADAAAPASVTSAGNEAAAWALADDKSSTVHRVPESGPST